MLEILASLIVNILALLFITWMVVWCASNYGIALPYWNTVFAIFILFLLGRVILPSNKE